MPKKRIDPSDFGIKKDIDKAKERGEYIPSDLEKKLLENEKRMQMMEDFIGDNINPPKEIEEVKKVENNGTTENDSGLFKSFGVFPGLGWWRKEKEEFKDPILMLVHRDGWTKIFEKVKPGMYNYKNTDGQPMQVKLDAKKLHRMKNPAGGEYKYWVHHEDDAESFPSEPKFHATQFTTIMDDLKRQQRDRDMLESITSRLDGKLVYGIIMAVMILAIVMAVISVYVPNLLGSFAPPPVDNTAAIQAAVKEAINQSSIGNLN